MSDRLSRPALLVSALIALLVSQTAGFGGLPKPFMAMEGVFDPHVHSFTAWDKLNYTYASNTIFNHAWGHDDYVKATRPSVLPPTAFLFMSLVGVPASQHVLQCELAQREAERIESSGLSPRMLGIVSDGDISLGGGFGPFLDEVVQAAPLVKGVRPFPLPWTDRSAMVAALSEIQVRGLSCDILLSSAAELQEIFDVASALPKLTLILNHLGFSQIPGGDLPDFDSWAAEVSRLSSLRNVYIKVSGGQRMDHAVDARTIVQPYVLHAIQSFGYERCIFNGNWFVVNQQEGFNSYRSWATFVNDILVDLKATAEERDWLLNKAGRVAYKI